MRTMIFIEKERIPIWAFTTILSYTRTIISPAYNLQPFGFAIYTISMQNLRRGNGLNLFEQKGLFVIKLLFIFVCMKLR